MTISGSSASLYLGASLKFLAHTLGKAVKSSWWAAAKQQPLRSSQITSGYKQRWTVLQWKRQLINRGSTWGLNTWASSSQLCPGWEEVSGRCCAGRNTVIVLTARSLQRRSRKPRNKCALRERGIWNVAGGKKVFFTGHVLFYCLEACPFIRVPFHQVMQRSIFNIPTSLHGNWWS